MSGKVPEINLVFDEPVQRKKTPKHLADYSPEERREVATKLGLPAFRANQIANHYFTSFMSGKRMLIRHTDGFLSKGKMTNLP